MRIDTSAKKNSKPKIFRDDGRPQAGDKILTASAVGTTEKSTAISGSPNQTHPAIGGALAIHTTCVWTLAKSQGRLEGCVVLGHVRTSPEW